MFTFIFRSLITPYCPFNMECRASTSVKRCIFFFFLVKLKDPPHPQCWVRGQTTDVCGEGGRVERESGRPGVFTTSESLTHVTKEFVSDRNKLGCKQ